VIFNPLDIDLKISHLNKLPTLRLVTASLVLGLNIHFGGVGQKYPIETCSLNSDWHKRRLDNRKQYIVMEQ